LENIAEICNGDNYLHFITVKIVGHVGVVVLLNIAHSRPRSLKLVQTKLKVYDSKLYKTRSAGRFVALLLVSVGGTPASCLGTCPKRHLLDSPKSSCPKSPPPAK